MLGRWPIEIIPDNPPTIDFAKPPSATPRAALRLDYRATDDYGVESVKAVIRRQGGKPGRSDRDSTCRCRASTSRRPRRRAITICRRIPGRACRSRSASSRPTRSARPARASRCTWSCPSASFTNPVARAIIDQRKELVKDPASAEAGRRDPRRSERAAGALPRRYGGLSGAAVGRATAAPRPRQGRDRRGRAAVVGRRAAHRGRPACRWPSASCAGSSSSAERARQRRARRRDRPADAAAAQALDRYMQALAQELQRHPNEATAPIDPSQALSERDLQRMLDRAARTGAQRRARRGSRTVVAAAEHAGKSACRPPGPDAAAGRQQAQQMMRGLQRTDAAPAATARPQLPRAAASRVSKTATGKRDNAGAAAGQQPGGERPNRRKPAIWAMPPASRRVAPHARRDDAAARRRAGRHPRAVRPGRAGDARRGRGAAARPTEPRDRAADRSARPAAAGGARFCPAAAAASGPRQFVGRPQCRRRQPDRPRCRRPDRARPVRPSAVKDGTYDQGDVKIPDENILQKARQILDELRRRAGERSRPQIELDYIDRLLQRF